MKRYFISILSFFLILSASFLAAPVTSVRAQGAAEAKESITLSPALSKPTADAGAVLKGTLTVINDGETEYQFLVYARPYSVKSETYDPDYTEVNERTEAYQWIQFEKTNLTLAAGARVEVPYTITIPAKAAAGGHYAVLFAETQPQESESTQVARKKRVGSLLYVTVNGELVNSGTLESWDTQLWQKNKPVTAAFRVKNDGNVHFQVNSQVTFSTIFNKPRLQLNQEQLVLPGTTRKIIATMEKTPSIGIYRVSGSVTFLDKTEQLESRWIILLPLQMVYILFAALIALLGWKVVKPRMKNRKKTKESTAARREDT